jgi:Uncharacterized protein conserved in bacteria
MASAFKKVAGYLGLMDGEELDHGTNQTAQRSPRLVRSENKNSTHSNVELLPHADSNKIMDHIISLTPRTYSEARLIGEHYRQGKPVIMNLSDNGRDRAQAFSGLCIWFSFWPPWQY